jgi:hypothetical protein
VQTSNAAKASATVAVLASSVWFGGLVVLGAIVAPIVFHNVPAPHSANAMTLVFRRFDKVAMGAAGLVLVAEALRVIARERVRAIDVVRIVVALIATALAVWQGTVLSPRIAALHQAGALRGFGPLGLELESLHTTAEGEAKAQLALVAALLALHVYSLAASPSAPAAKPGKPGKPGATPRVAGV